MSSPSNLGVLQAAEEYLSLSTSPKFALLIHGEWGCGKTYFVSRLINAHVAAGRKAVSVSLFGVSSIAQIDRQIYQQLHPLLGSEKLRFAGRLLAGVLSASIPIGGQASVDVALPELKLNNLAEIPSEQVVFFDDVERCAMPMREVLGYLNSLTELSEIKVVACINESEIQDEAEAEYRKHREKVFGRVLRLIPDTDAALDTFVRDISPEPLAELLRSSQVHITEVFDEVGHQNLRALRQALLLFEGLYRALPDNAKNAQDFLREYLRFYLVLALENADLALDAAFIDDLLGAAELRLVVKNEGRPSRGGEVRKKIGWIASSLIAQQSPEFWGSYFLRGVLDEKALTDLVLSHPNFRSNDTPNWVKLWWWHGLEQFDFDLISKSVLTELRQGLIDNVYVVLHATATILELTVSGLIGLSTEAWLNEARSFFIRLQDEPNFSRDGEKAYFLDLRMGYAGLGFPEHLAGFSRLKEFANEAFENLKEQRKQKTADALLERLAQGNIESFQRDLEGLHNKYLAYPVLAFIKLDSLAPLLMEMRTVRAWRDLAACLDEYLQRSTFIKEERAFLTQLDAWLKEELKSTHGTLVGEGQQLMHQMLHKHLQTASLEEWSSA